MRFAVLLIFCPCAAWAHAMLESAMPPVGSTVATAPAEITLSFSEGLEPAFSSIAVTDEAGSRVDRQDLHTLSGHPEKAAISLMPLRAGTYTVSWHAVSVDTHKTEGIFTFTVGP